MFIVVVVTAVIFDTIVIVTALTVVHVVIVVAVIDIVVVIEAIVVVITIVIINIVVFIDVFAIIVVIVIIDAVVDNTVIITLGFVVHLVCSKTIENRLLLRSKKHSLILSGAEKKSKSCLHLDPVSLFVLENPKAQQTFISKSSLVRKPKTK